MWNWNGLFPGVLAKTILKKINRDQWRAGEGRKPVRNQGFNGKYPGGSLKSSAINWSYSKINFILNLFYLYFHLVSGKMELATCPSVWFFAPVTNVRMSVFTLSLFLLCDAPVSGPWIHDVFTERLLPSHWSCAVVRWCCHVWTLLNLKSFWKCVKTWVL